MINKLKAEIINGGSITKEQALQLFSQPADLLCSAANEIRQHFCGNGFDLCTIINAKSGRCSENCKFCSQSGHYKTNIEEYPLLSDSDILKEAQYNADKGVLRFSAVTSGRALNNDEIDNMCRVMTKLKESVNIRLCASFGLLNTRQFLKLKEAGLARVHNNLETSQSYFPQMCTTHTFAEKVESIKAAQNAGLQVCSGGIFGIGESNQDRVELAFELKQLNINSIPVNLLNPAKGTPYENQKILTSQELCQIVAVYRFILPWANIRLAGGRGLLEDKGRSAFLSGANAAITGDMLTTSGISIDTDLEMLAELGYEVRAHE